MQVIKVSDDGMSNDVIVQFENRGVAYGVLVSRGKIVCKTVAARDNRTNETSMVPASNFMARAKLTVLETKLRTHLVRNNYFDLPLDQVRSEEDMLEARNKANDDYDRCVGHATELRDALRAVLDTRDILRAHPENDTTRVLDEKLINVQIAEEAAQKLLLVVDGE